ncbi:unnamed protein product, partial [Urochloa humidicola]
EVQEGGAAPVRLEKELDWGRRRPWACRGARERADGQRPCPRRAARRRPRAAAGPTGGLRVSARTHHGWPPPPSSPSPWTPALGVVDGRRQKRRERRWFSSLRLLLDLEPALLHEDADADVDLAVTELLDATMEGNLFRMKRGISRLIDRSNDCPLHDVQRKFQTSKDVLIPCWVETLLQNCMRINSAAAENCHNDNYPEV